MENNESQILLLLGEIKGQIGGFIASLAEVKGRADDHDSRLRTLETKSSKQSGVIIGITMVATAGASFIAFLAQHFLG